MSERDSAAVLESLRELSQARRVLRQIEGPRRDGDESDSDLHAPLYQVVDPSTMPCPVEPGTLPVTFFNNVKIAGSLEVVGELQAEEVRELRREVQQLRRQLAGQKTDD